MQTFLPYPDAARSVAVLDDRRLGKQRVEALQVLRALHLEGYGWSAHPAVTMWRGHTAALVAYGLAATAEWVRRGHPDRTREAIAEFVAGDAAPPVVPPPWWGQEALHRSHRSALLRKDPRHYGPVFGDVPDDLPYVWPPPPAPPAVRGPRSAWVVRSRLDGDRVGIEVLPGDLPWVPLDVRAGRILKRHRQVARVVDEMRPGDAVAVPHGEDLRTGLVAGPYLLADDHHVRAVRWVGAVRRADLRFPAALQDPQHVFELRDEPRLAEALRPG